MNATKPTHHTNQYASAQIDESVVREKWRKLRNDIDFDRIELSLNAPNIFNILGVSRTEIRHSNFLAWILDPNGSHGLGRLFISRFMREVAQNDIATDVDELEIDEFDFSNVEIRREWKNIDLLLIFKDLVVCIENKVDSQEHSNQLSRYKRIVEQNFPDQRKVFVYLTPFGDDPVGKLDKEFYVPHSYANIAEHAQRILSIHGDGMNQNVKQYIEDYIAILRRELMKNDSLNEMAAKLYKNHKEIFDFVFENKSDLASEISPIIEDLVKASGWIIGSKHKGYVRFLTPKLHDAIPRTSVYPQKESFIFEIDFYWLKKKAVFKTIIAPGNEEVRSILRETLERVEGSDKPRGNQWLVHFIYSWPFDKESLTDSSPEQVKKAIEVGWEEISKIVERVEKNLLNKQEELSKFC